MTDFEQFEILSEERRKLAHNLLICYQLGFDLSSDVLIETATFRLIELDERCDLLIQSIINPDNNL